MVDKDLARTNVPGEVLIGSDMEHQSSCRIDAQEDVWRSVISFLTRSVTESRTRLFDDDGCNTGMVLLRLAHTG